MYFKYTNYEQFHCFSLKMIFWVEGWGLYIDSVCRLCASMTTLVLSSEALAILPKYSLTDL